MPEKAPLYFKEFREVMLRKFDGIDDKFKEADKRFDSMQSSIDELAASTAQCFSEVGDHLEDIEEQVAFTDDTLTKIEVYIGKSEVRFSDFEDKILKNHGRRIGDL